MKIKRRRKRKKSKGLNRYQQFVKKLERDLKRTKQEAVPDDLITVFRLAPEFKRHENDSMQTKDEIEKEIHQRILAAESRVVKKAVADANKFIVYVKEEYEQQLNYSGLKFPRKWMLDDPKIKVVIKRRPVIIDFANYLFEYTRHISRKKLGKMIELTHGSTYGDKQHPLAVFKADADFWNKAAAESKCAVITLKKLLRQFCDADFVIELGQAATHERGRQPGLYADGYYVDWEGKPVKQPFLTKEKKDALLRLSKKKLAGI
jgi:hypothetical protein